MMTMAQGMAHGPKIAIVVQARMGSSRLPGKVLQNSHGKPLLYWLLSRLDRVGLNSEVVVATTEQPQDDQIVAYCQEQGRQVVRGSENDVLSRFIKAAERLSPEVVVRITADCPLMDPDIIRKCLERYFSSPNSPDYVSNALKRTFPRGMDVEVFSAEALYRAQRESTTSSEREHVTPYIYRNPDKFTLENVELNLDCSHYRWTVDTPEDFKLVDLLLGEALKIGPLFNLQDLLKIAEAHPEWNEINKHIEQKAH